jgi:ribonuclease-3 family protein
MSEISNPNELNGLLLAYLGDAQMELMIRKRLVLKGGKIGDLNKQTDALVSAKAQVVALEKLLPVFTEEEMAVFKRGKNVHTNSVPKSVTQLQYRKATGLEAVFGYLCLKNDTERMEELIDIAYFSE